MISVVMIGFVGFIAVFQHIYGEVNASLVGLALSYILSVTGLLNGLIVTFTETEKEMISVERLKQFENIQSEDFEGSINLTQNDWPRESSIEFFNVILSYRNDKQNALDNLSFKINPGLNFLFFYIYLLFYSLLKTRILSIKFQEYFNS